jgi:hypothetical protein
MLRWPMRTGGSGPIGGQRRRAPAWRHLSSVESKGDWWAAGRWLAEPVEEAACSVVDLRERSRSIKATIQKELRDPRPARPMASATRADHI